MRLNIFYSIKLGCILTREMINLSIGDSDRPKEQWRTVIANQAVETLRSRIRKEHTEKMNGGGWL